VEPSGTRHGGKIGEIPSGFVLDDLVVLPECCEGILDGLREISLVDRFTAVAARSPPRCARQTFALRARHCELLRS
jgi:hypothetical protein